VAAVVKRRKFELLAFTFPGQGSQRPGMGASWKGHPSFELVDIASEIVGRDVTALLLEADEETLRRTQNAQLATFVSSLVVLDAAERLGLEPFACAGHSLGEYSALVATGSLGYDDGLRLVAERGSAMQDAADGRAGTMMAVLGLDDDDVEAACVRAEGEVWIANYNAPGQVVIAGEKASLDRAAEIAKSLGAKRVLSFPVGGAFHTPFMAPARDRLRKAISEVAFRAPEPLVVANVDAKSHTDPADWPGLLSAQLCGPVRWRQSLATLAELGCRTFLELGPGGVLSGLAKRSLDGEGFSAHSIATPEDLEAFAETLAGTSATEEAEAQRFDMIERFIVSSAVGPFQPAPEFAAAAPTLGPTVAPLEINIGDLIGHAGETEIRSPFAGTLMGVIVLAGERVVGGQPVAWLRVEIAE
jgi:[acyl-carrier-protein] S-malonyltransferase